MTSACLQWWQCHYIGNDLMLIGSFGIPAREVTWKNDYFRTSINVVNFTSTIRFAGFVPNALYDSCPLAWSHASLHRFCRLTLQQPCSNWPVDHLFWKSFLLLLLYSVTIYSVKMFWGAWFDNYLKSTSLLCKQAYRFDNLFPFVIQQLFINLFHMCK